MVDVIFSVEYGSKLYGTATPTSDTDVKSIYLPEMSDLLSLKTPKIFKDRWDAQGNPVPEGASMPDNGVEVEYIPIQAFMRDFLAGQTYAVEIAFAVMHNLHKDPVAFPDKGKRVLMVERMIEKMVVQFRNKNVYSMVGFALKQTMDYVCRGDRLNRAKEMQTTINSLLDTLQNAGHDRARVRFDANTQALLGITTPLDYLESKGFVVGAAENNNKTIRTLELNGRSYLETTAIVHTLGAIEKLISAYGHRSTAAAESDVDFKSLSHAVRVYEQSIEYLTSGGIQFPRPNAVELLSIKQGKSDLEFVKNRLRQLDADVQKKIEQCDAPDSSELQEKFAHFTSQALDWFYYNQALGMTRRVDSELLF
jgi:RNA repair pathway DNA polymerase beta family